jgi:hypothetical protein
VAREGEDSKVSTGGGERGEATRGRRCRTVGRRTWPGRGGGVEQRRSRGDRVWGRRRGPGCKKQKVQGPRCKAHINFKLKLKCRWAQKQKCRVLHDLQLCFRVHLQKGNSFEINMKLSIIFKLYVNPIDKTTLHIYPKVVSLTFAI